MCGISGIVNLNHLTRQATAIHLMTNRLAHRGPDAEGIYVDDHIALGHRRLSIIDLSAEANQPMWDYTGRYALVFNGEIYNYKDVRSTLKDYPFKTQSDSEVVIAAYAVWGPQGLQHLNGMFAFAIWDQQEKTLFAARDRLGKKPFFYNHTASHFIFGSEVRSILASGLVDGKLDENQLDEFFKYQAAQHDHTLIQGIRRMPAGHYMLIKNGQLSLQRYWGYDHLQPSTDHLSQAKAKVKDLFMDSIRLRMVSDVPVGAFLSGGIDSSLVVACMAEQSTSPVHTFTISFDEKKYDESPYAEIIAKQYRTDHHRINIRPEAFLESFDEILSSMDIPSGDGPNTYLVSKYTRQAGVKVALSGLGGDELFAGYNKFLIYYKLMSFGWLQHIPVSLRYNLLKILGTTLKDHRFEKLTELAGLKHWDISTVYPVLRQSYNDNDLSSLLTHPLPVDGVRAHLATTVKDLKWMERLSQCTVAEMETYTRDVLLRDTDQMSMAHALEVRVPFFDYRLMEYVLSLPDHIKFPHTPKQLLVDALAPRLPQQISNRQKMGFTFPMEQWLRHELADVTEQKIQFLADRKEFNGGYLLKKWDSFKAGEKNILWSRIWKFVVLADWLQRNNL